MILQQQLDNLTAQFGDKIPEAAKIAMKKANEDRKVEYEAQNNLKVGDKLPTFSLKNQDNETVSLDALLKDGPLVISFFRGVWCPYCNLEVQALEAHMDKFRDAGTKVVVISPQTQISAKKSIAENGLSFDVLSDTGNTYASALNIAFTLPEEIKTIYNGFGINLPEYNGDESWSLPMPARFVINPSNTIVSMDVNPDYTQRPDPNETLAVLEAN